MDAAEAQARQAPRAWPFEEAARLAARMHGQARPALFETGYGPSGLPHIGTFGEVARTSWVRRAYQALTGAPTRLIAFSDDMDGLRKVPDNVPRAGLLAAHLGQPLSAVPDPFGSHESFAAHNNARLRAFLDRFGFEYEFVSATECYRSGRFDPMLRLVLERHEAVRQVILPTLGPDRRATYSPILPIHPETGVVMQVAIEKLDTDAGTVAWRDPASGRLFETPVTGGGCKLQWKADWAMRWAALGVDYEMSGKDLIDSVRLSGKVCAALGAPPPLGLTYELFLDHDGHKISKSKGNGLSVEEWLRYAPAESLAYFMYQAPQRAKRLHFDVIPKATDEYLAHAAKLPGQDEAARHANPAWHVDGGDARPGNGPRAASPVSFAMLLNLASVVNADHGELLWGFIRRYSPGAEPGAMPFLAGMVEHAVAYYNDFVRPAKRFRAPDARERAALQDLALTLRGFGGGAGDPGALQDAVFDVGRRHDFAEWRDWFGCLYQVLLGQPDGPRFGGFVALYGVDETVALIESALVRP